jgi:hypothetical protein
MTGRIPGGATKLVVALIAALTTAAFAASVAGATTIYNNIPHPLPGNYASIGNEAYSNSELGGLVKFAGSNRHSATVVVGMSSWACQEGGAFTANCKSKASVKFSMPMQLNVYNVGPGDSVGPLLTTVGQTFNMPYRPSASNKCTGEEAGDWFSHRSESCFHGKAFKIKFSLPSEVVLPAQAIISVVYNTSDHGPSPIGEAPCRSTESGCFYDSLNVGLIEPGEDTVPVGSDPNPNELYANTQYNEIDCGSSANLGTFGPTGACWEGDQVAFEVKAKTN